MIDAGQRKRDWNFIFFFGVRKAGFYEHSIDNEA